MFFIHVSVVKNTMTQRLNMLLNDQWITGEIKEEFNKIPWRRKHNDPECMLQST